MATEPKPDFCERNRASWNAATVAHNGHKQDQAGFLRSGGSTLFADEQALLGDPAGLKVLHACCNSGQDSLSLAALGAQVVGVDISDEAITFARRLSAESGIEARFERAEICGWLAGTSERFDVVFATYGVLGWLPDLAAWVRGVARVLKPGGRVVLLEFHPVVWSVDGSGGWISRYFQTTPFYEADGVGDYVGKAAGGLSPSGHLPGDEAFSNPHESVGFQWTVAQLLQGLIDAGLQLEVVREYPWSNGCQLYETMVETAPRRFQHGDSKVDPPLMLGVVARLY